MCWHDATNNVGFGRRSSEGVEHAQNRHALFWVYARASNFVTWLRKVVKTFLAQKKRNCNVTIQLVNQHNIL